MTTPIEGDIPANRVIRHRWPAGSLGTVTHPSVSHVSFIVLAGDEFMIDGSPARATMIGMRTKFDDGPLETRLIPLNLFMSLFQNLRDATFALNEPLEGRVEWAPVVPPIELEGEGILFEELMEMGPAGELPETDEAAEWKPEGWEA